MQANDEGQPAGRQQSDRSSAKVADDRGGALNGIGSRRPDAEINCSESGAFLLRSAVDRSMVDAAWRTATGSR